MNESSEIIKSVKKYIKEKYNFNEDDININLEKIDGMTNKNYHITFFNKNSPNKSYQILYCQYGKVLNSLTHDTEIKIMNYLSNKNEGPKILFKCNDYRIVEFISNSSIIPLELRYNEKILKEINVILSKYSQISNFYKYSISSDLKFNFLNNNKNSFQTIFDINEAMFEKAKKNYEIFTQKFTEHSNLIDEKIKQIKNKYDYYMNDYKKIFISLFPKNGFFILCHNDCQRWNFLYIEQNKQLMIIDHEYGCLCIPGIDICNYMNENSFYFYDDGRYEFKKDEINFEFYYQQYLNYLNEFIKLNKKWANDNENKNFFEEIKNKKYYINLHCITNIFWFLFNVINLDFEKEIIKKSEHYFEYGYDRLCYYEIAHDLLN